MNRGILPRFIKTKKTVKKCSTLVKLKAKDHVLDIASNDATLLNFYQKNIIKVGVDPLVNKYKRCYNKIDYKIPNFFQGQRNRP